LRKGNLLRKVRKVAAYKKHIDVIDRKVLIITYYWPPSGGSGVQRWLKFVKYLPQTGVMPYVFTPENPAFDIRDESLLRDVPEEAEVIRFPIWEPYNAFFRISKWFGGKKSTRPTDLVSTKKGSLFQRVSTWLRGNILIPDPRVFWVNPSVKFLHDFIQDHKIDTIITTGPPHSMHLIGYRLKKKNASLKWLADFRDPWSEWGFLDTLMVGTMARRIHRRLEGEVLKTADLVTTITPFYVRRFERLSGRKVHLLTNGYDEDDFVELNPVRTTQFIIRHVGIVNEKCNPRPFMQALKAAMARDGALASLVRVDFVGEVHPAFRGYVEKDPELLKVTTFTPTVPHKTLIRLYNESSLLLLVLEGYRDAEGYMPGKLFEYIATGLPVLGVGPANGDANELMKAAGVGRMVEGKEGEMIEEEILRVFANWSSRETRISSPRSGEHSRKNLTTKLATLIRDDC
jgi:glycosyltransferase involved in cell wall biosynthesis